MGDRPWSASRARLCLVCGVPDARLLRHPDGRYLRACDACLRSPLGSDWAGSVEREPLECEMSLSPAVAPQGAEESERE